MIRYVTSICLLSLFLAGCAVTPDWVEKIDESGELITKRYNVEHYLADDFFSLAYALSGGSSGGYNEPRDEDALFDKVRAIQSENIHRVLLSRTAHVPDGITTKAEWLEKVEYLPIVEEMPGVYLLKATRSEHKEFLDTLQELSPAYSSEQVGIFAE